MTEPVLSLKFLPLLRSRFSQSATDASSPVLLGRRVVVSKAADRRGSTICRGRFDGMKARRKLGLVAWIAYLYGSLVGGLPHS